MEAQEKYELAEKRQWQKEERERRAQVREQERLRQERKKEKQVKTTDGTRCVRKQGRTNQEQPDSAGSGRCTCTCLSG